MPSIITYGNAVQAGFFIITILVFQPSNFEIFQISYNEWSDPLMKIVI